jgi:hypothetical protein
MRHWEPAEILRITLRSGIRSTVDHRRDVFQVLGRARSGWRVALDRRHPVSNGRTSVRR